MRLFFIAAAIVAGVLLLGCVEQEPPAGLLNDTCPYQDMLGQPCRQDSDCCPKQVCGIPLGSSPDKSICGEPWQSLTKPTASPTPAKCNKQLQPCKSDSDCCENEICTTWVGYDTTVCILPIR